MDRKSFFNQKKTTRIFLATTSDQDLGKTNDKLSSPLGVLVYPDQACMQLAFLSFFSPAYLLESNFLLKNEFQKSEF